MVDDLRHAARRLAGSGSFTATAVLTLALGIGATTAVLGAASAVLLRPLPYPEAERLVLLWETQGDWRTRWVAPGNFVDWRREAGSFEGIAGFSDRSVNLTGAGQPERVEVVMASANVFDVLGVGPALGRAFAVGEDEGDGAQVALISHGLWQRRFAGDRGVLGAAVVLDGERYAVVGVLPPGFRFAGEADVWIPGRNGVPFSHPVLAHLDMRTHRDSHLLSVVARLREGVSVEAARSELETIAARLASAYPDTNAGLGANVVTLREHVVGDSRPALLLVSAAVALVLLVSCANVASLLLARGTGRRRELAVRAALGASRARLVRHALAEGILLAAGGGALGLLMAAWSGEALAALLPGGLPLAGGTLDAALAATAVLVSAAAVLLFALPAALQASRADVAAALHDGARSSAGRSGRRARRLLVVGEVAVAHVLLVGAALLGLSLLRLQRVDPGFDPEGVLTFQVSLPEARYGHPATRAAFYDRVLGRLGAVPGVERAGIVSRLPLDGGPVNRGLRIDGRPDPGPGEDQSIDYQLASPGLFSALRIPLRRGRGLQASDVEGAPRVVVINEAAARRFFPDEDPIGRRLGLGDGDDRARWRTIVGVVGDVRHRGLAAPPAPAAFAPYAQDREAWNHAALVLRASVKPESLAETARQAVIEADPEQPVARLRTMETVMADAVARPRAIAVLLGGFAGVAVLLAAVGLYGVVAYLTAQRLPELALRAAVGASPAALRRLVLREGAALALAGVLIGTLAARALSDLLAGLLFGVTPGAPGALAAAAAGLAALGVLATDLPARRAARADPLELLRSS